MYFIEGMPEGPYNIALAINKKWIGTCIGEIKIVKAFKYHGKVWCFYKDGQPSFAIVAQNFKHILVNSIYDLRLI